jgi:hypothetical protein
MARSVSSYLSFSSLRLIEWQSRAIIFYYILMAYVITVVLREKKPLG